MLFKYRLCKVEQWWVKRDWINECPTNSVSLMTWQSVDKISSAGQRQGSTFKQTQCQWIWETLFNTVTCCAKTEQKVAKKFKRQSSIPIQIWLSKNDNIQIHQYIGMSQDLNPSRLHVHLWSFSCIGYAKDKEQYFLCCDQKARGKIASSFTLWQQATIDITRRDHSVITCLSHIYLCVALRSHPVRGESQIQRNVNWEVATTSPPFCNEPHRSHVVFVKVAEVAAVTFLVFDSALVPKILNPEMFQIWESDSWSDSGCNHRSSRNLPKFSLKKWPHRLLLLPKFKSDSGSWSSLSRIFDSGSEKNVESCRIRVCYSGSMANSGRLPITPHSHPGHSTTLLRLENPSSKCAELHTVAASNNKDYTLCSFYLCLFVPHIYGCCSSCPSHSWWIAWRTITHSTPPWASAEFFPRGGNFDILLILYRLLTMQCKGTFAKRFIFSTPQRKCLFLRQSHKSCTSLRSSASFSLMLLFTQCKPTWLTIISSHCLTALSAKMSAFNTRVAIFKAKT